MASDDSAAPAPAAGADRRRVHRGGQVLTGPAATAPTFDQLLLDVAMHRCGVTFVLDRAGVPRGPATGVLTNAGGAGIAFADAAESAGLTVPRAHARTRARVRSRRPAASTAKVCCWSW